MNLYSRRDAHGVLDLPSQLFGFDEYSLVARSKNCIRKLLDQLPMSDQAGLNLIDEYYFSRYALDQHRHSATVNCRLPWSIHFDVPSEPRGYRSQTQAHLVVLAFHVLWWWRIQSPSDAKDISALSRDKKGAKEKPAKPGDDDRDR